MSSQGRGSGRSRPNNPGRGGTAANGKTTDSDNLMPLAQPGRTTATNSSAAAPRRGKPRRAEPTPSPKRPAATELSAPDSVRRPDRVPSGPVRSQAPARKAATRNRLREAQLRRRRPHAVQSSPNRTGRPDSSRSEYGEPANAPRSQEPVEAVVEYLKAYVQRLLDAARDRGEALTRKIQEWMDTLIEAIARGGAGIQAGLEGIRAAAAGKNPILAAAKSLISGLSGQAKVGLVLLLALGLLLGPVLLVVLLVVLVVAALVAAVRAAAE